MRLYYDRRKSHCSGMQKAAQWIVCRRLRKAGWSSVAIVVFVVECGKQAQRNVTVVRSQPFSPRSQPSLWLPTRLTAETGHLFRPGARPCASWGDCGDLKVALDRSQWPRRSAAFVCEPGSDASRHAYWAGHGKTASNNIDS